MNYPHLMKTSRLALGVISALMGMGLFISDLIDRNVTPNHSPTPL